MQTNKYKREVFKGVWIDVYDVLDAFQVTDAAMAHALKKMLVTGKRGHKNEAEDRQDILDSVIRSNEIFDRKIGVVEIEKLRRKDDIKLNDLGD